MAFVVRLSRFGSPADRAPHWELALGSGVERAEEGAELGERKGLGFVDNDRDATGLGHGVGQCHQQFGEALPRLLLLDAAFQLHLDVGDAEGDRHRLEDLEGPAHRRGPPGIVEDPSRLSDHRGDGVGVSVTFNMDDGIPGALRHCRHRAQQHSLAHTPESLQQQMLRRALRLEPRQSHTSRLEFGIPADQRRRGRPRTRRIRVGDRIVDDFSRHA